jgi:hypothetical protein
MACVMMAHIFFHQILTTRLVVFDLANTSSFEVSSGYGTLDCVQPVIRRSALLLSTSSVDEGFSFSCIISMHHVV